MSESGHPVMDMFKIIGITPTRVLVSSAAAAVIVTSGMLIDPRDISDISNRFTADKQINPSAFDAEPAIKELQRDLSTSVGGQYYFATQKDVSDALRTQLTALTFSGAVAEHVSGKLKEAWSDSLTPTSKFLLRMSLQRHAEDDHAISAFSYTLDTWKGSSCLTLPSLGLKNEKSLVDMLADASSTARVPKTSAVMEDIFVAAHEGVHCVQNSLGIQDFVSSRYVLTALNENGADLAGALLTLKMTGSDAEKKTELQNFVAMAADARIIRVVKDSLIIAGNHNYRKTWHLLDHYTTASLDIAAVVMANKQLSGRVPSMSGDEITVASQLLTLRFGPLSAADPDGLMAAGAAADEIARHNTAPDQAWTMPPAALGDSLTIPDAAPGKTGLGDANVVSDNLLRSLSDFRQYAEGVPQKGKTIDLSDAFQINEAGTVALREWGFPAKFSQRAALAYDRTFREDGSGELRPPFDNTIAATMVSRDSVAATFDEGMRAAATLRDLRTASEDRMPGTESADYAASLLGEVSRALAADDRAASVRAKAMGTILKREYQGDGGARDARTLGAAGEVLKEVSVKLKHRVDLAWQTHLIGSLAVEITAPINQRNSIETEKQVVSPESSTRKETAAVGSTAR